VIDTEAIPAKVHGDEKGALDIWTNKARRHFTAHRQAALLDAVNQAEKKTEIETAATISSRMMVLIGIGVGLLALIVIFGSITS
jgi:hypothetical protein